MNQIGKLDKTIKASLIDNQIFVSLDDILDWMNKLKSFSEQHEYKHYILLSVLTRKFEELKEDANNKLEKIK